MTYAKTYQQALERAGVKDDSIHHEFVSGAHGVKLDFDVTHKNRSSLLYMAGVMMKASMIMRDFEGSDRIGVLGIDTGTTQHARDVATVILSSGFGARVFSLTTVKSIQNGQKFIELTDETKELLVDHRITSVAIDDDVGTTGSSTAQPIPIMRDLGVQDTAVYYDWVRNPRLPRLDELQVAYRGMIEAWLPDYQPDDCILCDSGVPLVPYGREPM
ncbi:hypothetical protein KC968_02830 [Candidatus Saccharibacteria bacterium]|nr:hypothetical protein [Candidatus Saccharibacteria bacterium]